MLPQINWPLPRQYRSLNLEDRHDWTAKQVRGHRAQLIPGKANPIRPCCVQWHETFGPRGATVEQWTRHCGIAPTDRSREASKTMATTMGLFLWVLPPVPPFVAWRLTNALTFAPRPSTHPLWPLPWHDTIQIPVPRISKQPRAIWGRTVGGHATKTNWSLPFDRTKAEPAAMGEAFVVVVWSAPQMVVCDLLPLKYAVSGPHLADGVSPRVEWLFGRRSIWRHRDLPRMLPPARLDAVPTSYWYERVCRDPLLHCLNHPQFLRSRAWHTSMRGRPILVAMSNLWMWRSRVAGV